MLRVLAATPPHARALVGRHGLGPSRLNRFRGGALRPFFAWRRSGFGVVGPMPRSSHTARRDSRPAPPLKEVLRGRGPDCPRFDLASYMKIGASMSPLSSDGVEQRRQPSVRISDMLGPTLAERPERLARSVALPSARPSAEQARIGRIAGLRRRCHVHGVAVQREGPPTFECRWKASRSSSRSGCLQGGAADGHHGGPPRGPASRPRRAAEAVWRPPAPLVLGHQSTLDDPRLGCRRLVDRQQFHGVGGAKLAAVVEGKDDAGMLLLLGGMVPVEDGGQPVEFLGLRRVEVVPSARRTSSSRRAVGLRSAPSAG